MATNGLVVMTPTTVAKTGASSTATINSDGSVTFGSCETLSLNGVFTSSYDNYMVVVRGNGAGSFNQIRLRASGTDATGSNYVNQSLSVASTTVSGARSTLSLFRFSVFEGTQRGGVTGFFYGPNLAQPTAMRVISIRDSSSAQIEDNAGTHSLSVAYDGFTLYPSSGNITGLLTVFGFNQ